MNDEYLWQKIGDDPEIKKIEELLGTLRYRDSAPPALPNVAAERSGVRWFFKLALAAPAFAVLALVVGIWLRAGTEMTGNDVVFIHHPSVETQQVPGTIPPEPDPIVMPDTNIQREIKPTRTALRRRPAVQDVSRKRSAPALTEEEKYAYDRLLLALSISSSKMNVVRNAINGVDDHGTQTQSHR